MKHFEKLFCLIFIVWMREFTLCEGVKRSVHLQCGLQLRGELSKLTMGLPNAARLPHIISSWRKKHYCTIK